MAIQQKTVLKVHGREQFGKGHNRRLRAAGRVPANLYGLELKPFALSVNPRRVEELLRSGSGRNTILTLEMEGANAGDSRQVMIREIQRDPVHEGLTHIDFVRLDLKQKLQIKVPLNLVGSPIGVRSEGGLMEFMHRELLVACLPSEIPEHVDVDVDELHIGQQLAVKDLKLPEGVESLEDAETVLLVIAEPKAEEEETVEGEEGVEADADADAAATDAPAEPAAEGGDKS